MRFKQLLLCGALALVASIANATIVDGVRQRPTYETTGFATGLEGYLYNVGAGQFFTQGNSWGTQASVGSAGRKVRFTSTGSDDYYMEDYCWRTDEEPGGYMAAGWRYVFFDSETALFVDRNNQANYYFEVEDNGGTFRLSTSYRNPSFGDYAGAGLYVGLTKNTMGTVLSPFVDEDEAYVDWAFVTEGNYNALAPAIEIYEKAQELKEWIDKIQTINGDVSALSSVYLNENATMSELQAAIDSAQPLYIAALINNAPDKENVDVTTALKNPDFENGETGWTVTATAGSGANGHAGNVRPGGSASNQCYEAWNNSSFDIYQTLTDMPVGVYEIEVQGFYRYGRGDVAWNAYLAQSVEYVKPEGVPVYVYLNNNATNFVNVFGDDKQITNASFYSVGSSDYSSQSDGGKTYYFPDGMASAAIAFSDGMYKQSAFGLIANAGDAFRIGVKGNSSQLGDSWVIWDNFKLYYRGFKAEVVQPILEAAMADLNQYANLLMGKTEYATLNSALTAAQTAISNQDGEAMFAALNNLYNVKESVIVSKDLFLEQTVSTDLAMLKEAIANVAGEKLSAATRAAATTLAVGIEGNTIYEGTQIEQLKSDVSEAISNLSNSVSLYSQLHTAITALEAAVQQKAYQELINAGNEALTSAQTAYNNGTVADADVNALVESLNSQTSALNSSATAYTNLNNAIARLETAIAEASAEEAHVANSTLKKANLRLNASKNLYGEGTIADSDIASRISAIDALITELTHSIELYRQFNTGLTSLQEALATTDKLSSATRTAAQTVYDTALEAYNAGSIDDDKIEAQIVALTAQKTAIGESVALYADLAEALESLQPVVGMKAMQTLMDEVNELNAKQNEYEEGSIADEDINGIISRIEAIIPQVEASAEKYADLAAAITRLEAAIAEASSDEARVAKSTVKKANLRLTASQNLYDAGTISDEDIAARVETIDQLIEELTASIRLYQEFLASLQSLQTALATNDKMAAATRAAAQTVYDTAFEAYNAGTVDDDQIEAQKNVLNAQIEAMNISKSLYAQLKDAINALQVELDKDVRVATEVRTTAETAYTTASTAYEEASIADGNVAATISNLNVEVANLQQSAGKYADLAAAIEGLSTAIEAAEDVPTDILANSNALKDAAQTGYDNGTFADVDIDAEVLTLSVVAANIGKAEGIEGKATARTTELAQLSELLAETKSLLEQAKEELANAYVESSKRSEIDAVLSGYEDELSAIESDRDDMSTSIGEALTALNAAASDLTTNHSAALTTADTSMTDMEQEISEAQEMLKAILAYLAVQPAKAIDESANIVELQAEYGTFCSARDLDFTNVEGLEAYIVSDCIPADHKVILTRVYNVPAGTGLIVRGTPDGRYEIPEGDGTDVPSNLLVGTTRSKVLSEENGEISCVLADGAYGIGFYPTEGGSLAAGGAYLPLLTSYLDQQDGDKGFALFIDNGTGINGVKGDGQEDVWYTVGGQLLQQKPHVPGIYVRNGKKELVK